MIAVAKHGDVARGEGWELRCGDYREVLADLMRSTSKRTGMLCVDAVITDTPYSKRTHAGHNKGSASANRISKADEKRMRVDNNVYAVGVNRRRKITYAHWDAAGVESFVEFWHRRTNGWICAMSDDVLLLEWRRALESQKRLGFPAIPCVIPGMTVRLMGDGPSSWSVHLNVARPRKEPFSKWGTLRGEYRYTSDRGHIGGKPLAMMRAIVRDYSRRDDLVCDPCAGGGTTLLAAVLEGRRAIGAEVDPATYELAVARLCRGYTPAFDI